MPEPRYCDKGAVFSPCRRYRYRLWRTWNPNIDRKPLLFVMLNPSTADERVLDPTVRRCLGYAMAWGYGRMDVVNIFAVRSTDPSELYHNEDPVGADNNAAITQAANEADMVIAAWGNHGEFKNRGRQVSALLRGIKPLYALGMTKLAQPKHPLYLSKDLKPFSMEVLE